MDGYLSINEIAKLFKVSHQTLHFYDKTGLFKPEYRDSHNGYRKYSHNQIGQLSFIIYLRTIGFSIERIKEIMNGSDIDQTIRQLQLQSHILEARYEEIFKIDKVIQRKLMFVQKHKERTAQIAVREYPKRAYVKLGRETELYENKIFYYFPTIAFYNYNVTESGYEKLFGAYLEPEDLNDHGSPVEYMGPGRYLCLYHNGPYEDIPGVVTGIYNKYENLSLSPNFICMNIVDQFLEKDPKNFVTEIQIPIDYIVTI